MTIRNKAIETRQLEKRFGKTVAVEGLTLEVYEGEIFGLLGPNGAGKTTTMRMLMTLLRPTAGEGRVLGFDIVRESREVRRQIGYVPQEKSVDRFMTGREHLRLMAALYHLSGQAARQRIQEVLQLVDLRDKADELVRNYSGGMKKKLDIACGLIANPRLIFMDEPSLGLDVQSRLRVWEHIRTLRKQNMTVLLSTNYLEEADQLCDRLAIIDGGRVKALGSPAELKDSLGGDRILIELGEMPPAERKDLVQAMGAFDFVREIKETDRSLEVWIKSHQEGFTGIFQKVSNGRYPLRAIHYMKPSLEEVFVRHTGHSIAEEAGDG